MASSDNCGTTNLLPPHVRIFYQIRIGKFWQNFLPFLGLFFLGLQFDFGSGLECKFACDALASPEVELFMLANTQRILIAAFKEFWLPLALAISLMIGGISIEKMKSVQGYFFAFLMLAWFTG